MFGFASSGRQWRPTRSREVTNSLNGASIAISFQFIPVALLSSRQHQLQDTDGARARSYTARNLVQHSRYALPLRLRLHVANDKWQDAHPSSKSRLGAARSRKPACCERNNLLPGLPQYACVLFIKTSETPPIISRLLFRVFTVIERWRNRNKSETGKERKRETEKKRRKRDHLERRALDDEELIDD